MVPVPETEWVLRRRSKWAWQNEKRVGGWWVAFISVHSVRIHKFSAPCVYLCRSLNVRNESDRNVSSLVRRKKNNKRLRNQILRRWWTVNANANEISSCKIILFLAQNSNQTMPFCLAAVRIRRVATLPKTGKFNNFHIIIMTVCWWSCELFASEAAVVLVLTIEHIHSECEMIWRRKTS